MRIRSAIALDELDAAATAVEKIARLPRNSPSRFAAVARPPPRLRAKLMCRAAGDCDVGHFPCAEIAGVHNSPSSARG